MATFKELFDEYYTLYRAEAEEIPNDDDEFIIARRLANTAIRRWAAYDNTMWKTLFMTSTDATDGTTVTTAGTATYDAPADMQKAGGLVKLKNSDGVVRKNYPLIEPNEVQLKGSQATYAYFSGDPGNGFTLHLNPAPTEDDLNIEYVYYKQPTFIEDGDSVPEMSNPDFIIHHMLANRYRASRNPYYGTAKQDAENMLGQMKLENNSGTWTNPWTVPDTSGSVFGQEQGNMWG